MAKGVREALEGELKRTGFAAAPSADQADAVLRATLTAAQAWTTDLGTFHWAFHTKMLIDLALEDRARHRIGVAASRANRDAPGTSHGAGEYNGFINTDLAIAMSKLGPALLKADLSKLKSSGAAAAAKTPVLASVSAATNDVDVPEPSVPVTHPHFYAVVIGVGRYRKNLPPADFADADATMVSRYVAGYGVPSQNIVTLLNDEATRSDFEKYFEKWLPNHVESGDVVLVYFSGHGAPNPKTGDAFLVPYDGDPLYLDETAYPLKKLYAQLAKLPTDKISVVLDSCFSGAGGRSSSRPARGRWSMSFRRPCPRRSP